jgi:PAS domain S-box-containing protein
MAKTGEIEQVGDDRKDHSSGNARADNLSGSAEFQAPKITEKSPDTGLGIRLRLACLAAVCVLPVLIGSGFLVFHSYRLKRELMDRDMLHTARALTQVVDRELGNMEASLTVLATSPSLDSGDLKAFHHQALMVLQEYEGGDIILADASGQQLVNSFRPFGTQLPRRAVRDEVRRVYATGKPSITNLFLGAVTGRPLIGVDVPVIRDGRVIYDLAMTLPAGRIAAVLKQQNLPPDWIGSILDGDHMIVARTRLPERFVGSHITSAFQLAIKAGSGTSEFTNLEGTRVINSFTCSPMSGWTVVIGVPKSIFMAEVWHWLWWMIAATVVLSTVGIWLAVLIARSVARIEEALRHSREWLRVTLSSIGDAVLTTDTKGRITFLNPVAADLTGWQSSEAEGKPVQSVFGIINEQTRIASEDLISRVLKERQAVELANHTSLMARDGREIPIEDSAAPIWDGSGNILGVVIVFHDVTERRQAEDALRESEREFRTLADAIPQLCWMANADGWLFWYNQRWYEFTGTTSEQMEGWGWQSVHDPEALPQVLEQWAASVTTGKPFEMVFPLRRSDGVFHPFLTRVMPFKNAEGKVVRWFGTNTDIYEQQKAGDALRESEAQLQLFIEHAPAGLAMFDKQMRYLHASHRWMTDYHLGDRDLRGLSHYEVFPEIPERWKENHRRGLAGEVVRSEGERFERVSGSAQWVRWEIRPWRDAKGEVGGIVIFSEDITAREQADEALRSSQAKLQSIVGSAMDAVISVDERQRIVLFNQAAETAFQCPASEALGATLDRFIPELLREVHREHIRRFGTEGVSQRSMTSPAILAAVRTNGEEFPIEATVSQVEADGEKLYTVILRDITGRKQAEQALLRSEKLASVGRMAATIAHEINNPLAATTNALYIAMSQKDLTETTRHYLEAADSELRRIAHITRQSLGFYREFNAPALTSVNAVLESAVDLLKSKIRTKQAVIEKEWDEDVEVVAVAGELRQVFSNLLANSLDAIDQKGTIKLRVSACSAPKNGHRCVRITIADNGVGIPADLRQHLFEPFFTTKGAIGTGLGLWVSKQIIDKHEGTIRVRSSACGLCTGTVFSLVLPAELAKTVRKQSAGGLS